MSFVGKKDATIFRVRIRNQIEARQSGCDPETKNTPVRLRSLVTRWGFASKGKLARNGPGFSPHPLYHPPPPDGGKYINNTNHNKENSDGDSLDHQLVGAHFKRGCRSPNPATAHRSSRD
jgi:hypothetical protein